MVKQLFFQRLLAILVFVLFTNIFFFHSFGPVAFSLLALGFFFFLTLVFTYKNSYQDRFKSTFLLLFPLSLFLLGALLRANRFITLVLVMAVFDTLLVQAYLLSSQIPMVRSLFEFILSPIYLIGSYIQHGFKLLRFFGSSEYKEMLPEKVGSSSDRNSLIRSIVIGLIIGIFVVGILISMFSGADPIFAKFIKNILSADFLRNLPARIFYSVLVGLILLPYVILKRKNIFKSPIELFKRLNFVREMTIVMFLVASMIGLFLIIQWPYVFANVPFETDLSKFGVATYSEYVRKGFGELLKIALFVYGLIWAGLVIMRENKAKGKNMLRSAQFIVLTEFFIFLISILRRVWLYQMYHGWSLIRVYGSFLLVWIMGITIFLMLRHFRQKRWVIGEMIFTVVIVFLIGVVNVEQFIVTTHPPTVNKRVDYVYLSRMSADGYVGWLRAFQHSRDIINKYAKYATSISSSLPSQPLHISADERRDMAYAGIIIRELLKNHKALIRDFGTQKEMKDYVTAIYTYKSKILSKRFLSNDNPSKKEETDKILKYINEDILDYKIMIDDIYISNSKKKYEFNINGFLTSGEDSFIEIPYYYDNHYYNRIKRNEKMIDSFIDAFYKWNASSVSAYENMKKEISYVELLQLDEKYFDLYSRIRGVPPNERGYEMDISLDSPLLD